MGSSGSSRYYPFWYTSSTCLLWSSLSLFMMNTPFYQLSSILMDLSCLTDFKTLSLGMLHCIFLVVSISVLIFNSCECFECLLGDIFLVVAVLLDTCSFTVFFVFCLSWRDSLSPVLLYRKPTHIELYLKFHSNHSFSTKSGIT